VLGTRFRYRSAVSPLTRRDFSRGSTENASSGLASVKVWSRTFVSRSATALNDFDNGRCSTTKSNVQIYLVLVLYCRRVESKKFRSAKFGNSREFSTCSVAPRQGPLQHRLVAVTLRSRKLPPQLHESPCATKHSFCETQGDVGETQVSPRETCRSCLCETL